MLGAGGVHEGMPWLPALLRSKLDPAPSAWTTCLRFIMRRLHACVRVPLAWHLRALHGETVGRSGALWEATLCHPSPDV